MTMAGDKRLESGTSTDAEGQEKLTGIYICHNTCYYHFLVTAVITFCLMASACQIYIIKQEVNDLRQEVNNLKQEVTRLGVNGMGLTSRVPPDIGSQMSRKKKRSVNDGASGDMLPQSTDKQHTESNDNNPEIIGRANFRSINSFRREPTGRPPQPAGSSFTRWGKQSCPPSTTTLYSGYAAGAYPMEGFGGSELGCFHNTPSWNDNSSTNHSTKISLTAAMFHIGVHTDIFPSAAAANDTTIFCAVCISRRTPTVMIPGRVTCPHSWVKEYHGYLMASPSIPNQYYFSSHYCVDHRPDYYRGYNDTGGPELTFVQAGHCYGNREPCANYEMRNRISCTVCSKDR